MFVPAPRGVVMAVAIVRHDEAALLGNGRGGLLDRACLHRINEPRAALWIRASGHRTAGAQRLTAHAPWRTLPA